MTELEGEGTNHPILPPDSQLQALEPQPPATLGRSLLSKVRQRWQRKHSFAAIIGIILLALKLFLPPVYQLLNGPVIVTRYDRKAGASKATVGPDQPGWTPLQRMSRHILHAVIAAEDGRFYEHHGIDIDQVVKSYEVNKKRKRYARGASTISQQVVKMSFLGREKTLTRKAREAVGTVIMEQILTKDQILEWYLNLIEFGDGVYGVKEGAWHYFRTKPELLTVEQSVHLALVLPSPNSWSRGLRQRALTPFGEKRFLAIINTMRNMGFITKSQWTDAVTRGDFGRPLVGFSDLMAEPEKAESPELEDDDFEDVEAVDEGAAIPDEGEESEQ